MPTLPIFNSQRNIQPTTGQPLRNEAAQSFEAQNNLLATATNIAQKWSDANDVMQYTQAKANYEVATTDIQTRAAADPDYNNSPKYFKELEEIKKNSLSLIANQAVAGKAALEFDMGNRIAQIKIGADFKQKQLKVNQFNAKSLVESLEAKRLSAPPKAQEQYSLQIKQVLEANVASGTLSLDEADKILKNSQKTAAQAMINADPELAKKMLTQGKFPDLSPTDQVNLLQVADKAQEQRLAEIKKVYAEQKKATETSLQEKFFKETLTINEIEEQLKTPENEGGADRNTLQTMKDNLYKASKAKITDYIGIKYPESLDYVNTVDKVLDKDTDIIRAREILIKSYADGKISKEEGLVLDNIKNMSDSIAYKKTGNLLEKWYLKLRTFANGGYISDKSVEEQAQDLRDYLIQASQPEAEPEKIAIDIMEKRKVSNYPTFADWKKGETYNTGIGPVKFIDRDKDGMPIIENLNVR